MPEQGPLAGQGPNSSGYFALGVLTTLVLTIMATLVVPNPYRNDLRALIKKAYNTASEMFSPQADERLFLGDSLQQAEESESKPFAAQQLASPRRRKAQNAPVLILPSAPRKGAREECLSACKFIAGQAIKYGLAHFLAKKALKASWEALLMNQVTLIRETPARWALRTHKRRKPASMHYEFE